MHLFGVFDGHGGKEVAMLVKEKYVDLLTNLESFKKGDYKTALSESFVRMDIYLEEEEGREALKKFAKTDGQPANPFFSADKNMDSIAQGVGCTACVALMADNKIIVANAGDSRAVVCQKGKDIALSKDHKPDDDVEKRRI